MHLLQIKAVKLNPKQPFTWASGLHSPIYCDNRVTLSYPMVRTYIRQQFVEKLMQHYGKPDVIAGVATGGIAQGALVAQELGLPFAYVRSEKKSHGMQNQIEGVIESGQSAHRRTSQFGRFQRVCPRQAADSQTFPTGRRAGR